jgi:hypothetical protein
MSELVAYCDESGIRDGSTHCVLVGFVGTAQTWRRFESQWARASASCFTATASSRGTVEVAADQPSC